MSAAFSIFKMSTSCSNTWSKSLSKWQDLLYQWTVANLSISIARQSSARQCWSVLACISDSVPASRPAHDNPVEWDLANLVAIRFFQQNRAISSRSSLGQELLCEQLRHLAERWSCLIGDACSLWLYLAVAWWRRNWRSLWPFGPHSQSLRDN